MVESVGQNIRYTVRGLRRRPGFALSATLTIGVGIGALASVLSVLSAMLLRPAPYPTADRIVQIEQVVDGRPRDEVSTLDIRALGEGSASLSHVTIAWFSDASIAGDGLPERARRASGGIAAVWTASLLRSAVYGIDRTSRLMFAGAGLVLAAAVLSGCYLPARHAAQIDPVAALRAD
jgi:ABC-type antimicrobial peptide transport system permease subunit